jgi:heme A synthase
VWRKKRKAILIVAGVLYVVFGILAFFDIPGGHEEHHHSFAHNLTHIILGLILLFVTTKTNPRVRKVLCFFFTSAYCLIGLFGAGMSKTATLKIVPGIVEFHAGDYGVHLATAFFFFVIAGFKRSDKAEKGKLQFLKLFLF